MAPDKNEKNEAQNNSTSPASRPEWVQEKERIAKANADLEKKIQDFFNKNQQEMEKEFGLTNLSIKPVSDSATPAPTGGALGIENCDALKNVHGVFDITFKYKKTVEDEETKEKKEIECDGLVRFESDGHGGGRVYVDPNNPGSVEAAMALAKSLGVKGVKVSEDQSPEFKDLIRDACIKHGLAMNGKSVEELTKEKAAGKQAGAGRENALNPSNAAGPAKALGDGPPR